MCVGGEGRSQEDEFQINIAQDYFNKKNVRFWFFFSEA